MKGPSVHSSLVTRHPYIQAAEQVSIQEPLSDSWFTDPHEYDKVYVRAIEPDFKKYIPPAKARRMGRILKRAVICAQTAVDKAGTGMPDAIISATGLGCIENTEIFLKAMATQGEEFLQPTHFMQSTHNTISSVIAIEMKCHGYNNTYSQKGISFDSALLDAYLQFRRGKINTALVGGYDEMTPSYHLLLSRIGYWRADGDQIVLKRGEEAFSGETSVSFLLSGEKNDRSLCRLAGMEMLYRPGKDQLADALERLLQQAGCSLDDMDAVMTGISGNRENDAVYYEVAQALFPGKTLAVYKNIFGESYTASGLGMYAASVCLQKKEIPAHLLPGKRENMKNVERILLYNQYENKNHSFILLTNA